jgi:hypothetical protein
MVTVEVDYSHYKDLGPKTKEITKRGLELSALDLVNKLMKNSPVDHGLLKQWAITSRTASSITIKSPAKYAAAQNWGSSHMIKPKSKKALHWGGSPGFFSKGHMINIKGKHFVEKSINEVRPKIPEHFQIAIKEVVG